MPGPFSTLSKLQKAEIAKQLDEVIIVDGKEVRKGDLLDTIIKGGLGSGGGTEDIMRSLRKQGMGLPPAYVRERMAIVRRNQGPIQGDRGYDKRHSRNEINYIIERGLANGDDWDGITKSLQEAYPNRDVSKIIEVAKDFRSKQMQQVSPPAIVDSGDGRTGGPRADEEPPVRGSELDPAGPVQSLADMRGMSEEGLLTLSKKAMDEARRRKKEADKARKAGAESKVDWGQFDELFDSWRAQKAKPEVTEGDKVYPEENLDVPIEQPGFDGPIGRPQ